jgi:addiction module HigA family antidote
MMHNPPHPGVIVKKTLIDGANLNVTEAAKLLGVGRVSLSKIINGHSGISPEMAVRLSIALNTSSKMWLSMQDTYDLWQVEKYKSKLVKQIFPIKQLQQSELRSDF